MVYRNVYELYLDFFDKCRIYISDNLYCSTFKLYMKYLVKHNSLECRENAAAVNVLIEVLTDFCAVKGLHIKDFIRQLLFLMNGDHCDDNQLSAIGLVRAMPSQYVRVSIERSRWVFPVSHNQPKVA